MLSPEEQEELAAIQEKKSQAAQAQPSRGPSQFATSDLLTQKRKKNFRQSN
jgi:hypothetical protein